MVVLTPGQYGSKITYELKNVAAKKINFLINIFLI